MLRLFALLDGEISTIRIPAIRLNYSCYESDEIMPIASDNRRKVKRISLDDRLYAIIDTTPQTLGQVVEISPTGLAFTFVDIGDVSRRLAEGASFQLDLFEGGHGFFARGLPCRVVSKKENVSDAALASFSINRVGVAFELLTLPQQVRINRLVRQQNN